MPPKTLTFPSFIFLKLPEKQIYFLFSEFCREIWNWLFHVFGGWPFDSTSEYIFHLVFLLQLKLKSFKQSHVYIFLDIVKIALCQLD